MFLFVMLSFAIISEVSASGNAEINGTGFDPSFKSDMLNHDMNGKFIQDRDDAVGDYNSHNEQKSFDRSSQFQGDQNRGNENLYEQNGEKSNDKTPLESDRGNDKGNFEDNHRFDGDKYIDRQSIDVPMDNFAGDRSMDLPRGNFSGMNGNVPMDVPRGNFSDMSGPMDLSRGNFSDMSRPRDNGSGLKPMDLRNNNLNAVQNKGEVMGNVMANFMGLNKIAPAIKLKSLDNSSDSEQSNANGKDPNQKDFKIKNSQKNVSKNTKTLGNIKKVNGMLLRDIGGEMIKL